MGRRKSSTKKISNKKRPTLDTSFKCPFCCHDKVVQCTMNFKDNVGTLQCRRCDTKYSTVINYLSEPIDIFTEWIDAAEAEHAANQELDREDEEGEGGEGGGSSRAAAAAAASDGEDSDI
ncbi:transcription elongation factor Elf1 like-domain-containing protein [Tribonema minus]|uniref:Transcription elongation factor 1 homolog n=1 Tax=Tribonema minus TaxID=303371 RepID=A0A835ZFT2_9STRA|nr:transcription elongation factor Elf1 like-domain-containing protein [Tribonema minus]